MSVPICALCGVRERALDTGALAYGSDQGYFLYCTRCSLLCGHQYHTHTYYGSPEQIKDGTVKGGHSWRRSVTLYPIIENDIHVGFRCKEFSRCDWEQRFTAEDMEMCPIEHISPNGIREQPLINFMCQQWRRDHRLERGEISPHGDITEYGRKAEQERYDAANWDPGP